MVSGESKCGDGWTSVLAFEIAKTCEDSFECLRIMSSMEEEEGEVVKRRGGGLWC